jgi:hypothetical protein
MAAKKKGPGARNAGTLRNRVRRRKKSSNSKRSRRTQAFAPRREYWLYDGTRLLATLIVKSDGETRAFGADRRSLGSFPTFEAATAAINDVGGGAA